MRMVGRWKLFAGPPLSTVCLPRRGLARRLPRLSFVRGPISVIVRLREPPTLLEELIRISVEGDADIVSARQRGRILATSLGFSSGDVTLVATAISELARNIVLYARRGEILLATVADDGQAGLTIIARDDGDGIVDVSRAMQDGYSTSGRLGVGLPGVKRLMDAFEIVSEVGRGTTVTVKKWKRSWADRPGSRAVLR
jgi:serine/threonine-protein kinase RsbT